MQLGLVVAVDLDFQHGAREDSSITSTQDIGPAALKPQRSFAIIEDARLRARRRRQVAASLLAIVLTLGAVLLFSVGQGGAGASNSSRHSREASAGVNSSGVRGEVIVDGVTIYTAAFSDGGPALYSFEPFGSGDPATSQETANFATTGDLEGCDLLAERPGMSTKGCALLIAQVRAGDLQPKVGRPKVVHSVCGRPPGPGEIACKGTVTDREINASLRELRRELK